MKNRLKLPKGWKWARLQDVYDVRDGTHDTPKYTETGFPLVTSKNLYSGSLDFSDIKYISEQDHLKIKERSKVDKGDILFAMIGSIGNPVIVNTDVEFSIKNVALFKPYSAQLSNTSYLQKYLIKAAINLREEAAGAVQSFVSLGVIRNYLIPLSPLTEQHHIVAKVDELKALCDHLKTRIQQANQQQQAIADALVAQALKPATAEIIDLAAYRAAVTCNIIKRMQHHQAFGRTFLMKFLSLSQLHIGFELHLALEREAAGPFDKWIYDFEREAIAAGWFGLVEKQLSNGKTKIEYQVKAAIDKPLALFDNVGSALQRKELDRLFTLFADKKTEEAEIIATLFAVWNDFLIDGNLQDDNQVIKEVRENWHSSKARFSAAELTKWLDWMRRNNIVPQGRPSHTVYQNQLISS